MSTIDILKNIMVRIYGCYFVQSYSSFTQDEDMCYSSNLLFYQGSKRVEGIILNLPILEDLHLKTEAFGNMKNLRLLQINSVHLT